MAFTYHEKCQIVPDPCFMYFWLVDLGGMDASAQTSSHEMTIPNDVSISTVMTDPPLPFPSSG
jgi:hypothetical protein